MTPLGDLDKVIQNLVKVKAEKLSNRRIEKIRQDFITTRRIWANEIRRSLMVPAWKDADDRWVKNDSDTPRKRTGELSNSVPSYVITTRKTFGASHGGSSLDLGTTNIQMKRRVLNNAWDTYGEDLNNWSSFVQPTSLDGWKERAYQKLQDAIFSRIKRYT